MSDKRFINRSNVIKEFHNAGFKIKPDAIEFFIGYLENFISDFSQMFDDDFKVLSMDEIQEGWNLYFPVEDDAEENGVDEDTQEVDELDYNEFVKFKMLPQELRTHIFSLHEFIIEEAKIYAKRLR
jgi:hypothetical protein